MKHVRLNVTRKKKRRYNYYKDSAVQYGSWKKNFHLSSLIKSFIARYIAANTAKRESITVKTGFSFSNTESSFCPPKAPKTITTSIWMPILVYFINLSTLFFFNASVVFFSVHLAGSTKNCTWFNGKFCSDNISKKFGSSS